jgi:hypothetical protein
MLGGSAARHILSAAEKAAMPAHIVMPARGSIQPSNRNIWIPAFAGMTIRQGRGSFSETR